MKRRIERAPLPDIATMRRLVGEQASELCEGAVVVDADAQGSTGVDLLMVDGLGRPVFVDVVTEDAASVLARVFEHLAWIAENKRLFLRAYAGDGVSDEGTPSIVFVGERYSRGVVDGLTRLSGLSVRLMRAEYLIIDGEGELLLEEVASTGDAGEDRPSVGMADERSGRIVDVSPRTAVEDPAPAVAVEDSIPSLVLEQPPRPDAREEPSHPTPEQDASSSSRLGTGIESESALGLLKLFTSGVDGLDGRIIETESNGGAVFELHGRRLAGVSVSPGSFTVTPGDRVGNPIVVSDRVSLERALNAVVSLFVREGRPESDSDSSSAEDTLDSSERSELVGIWGSGLGGNEN
jgi:hypothetical protein